MDDSKLKLDTELPEVQLREAALREVTLWAKYFNDYLHKDILPKIKRDITPALANPVIYCLDSPGKRIRPVLTLLAAGLEPATNPTQYHTNALLIACAIECIHTYSLIHDDLPAMDDDQLRRGRPTAHIQFSEWAAILAGDALNTYAFELLSRVQTESLGKLVSILSTCSGMTGMIAGQTLDLGHEGVPFTKDKNKNLEELQEIHTLKTARLIAASCQMGAIISGADDELCRNYYNYGLKIGLLFQITDDLLDVQGSAEETGKAVQKDSQKGKWTYPSILGLEESKQKADDLKNELQCLSEILKPVSSRPDYRDFWNALPTYILNRKK